MEFRGQCLIKGTASAELQCCPVGLSFWGGVNPETGQVVDHHHPLCGQSVAGRILAIPCGRGSCSGSTVMLELLLNGCAPAALIFEKPEQILTLGVLVGKVLFECPIPVVVLSSSDFSEICNRHYAAINGETVLVSDVLSAIPKPSSDPIKGNIDLSDLDRSILAGEKGQAANVALQIIISFAVIQGARSLLDVSQAHIDACIYTGPASLRFAQKFQSMGAKFTLPTTLNSISIDQRRWKELNVDPTLASQAGTLANVYLSMGAQPSFTCAPYTLEDAPKAGEDIGWSESNAVVFANSILGAQTQKYPDFIDVCIALTGRAPSAGCHLPEGRRPTVCIRVCDLVSIDDSYYPLLGYVVGKLAQNNIPLVCGLVYLQPRVMDLKAFSAAFGTTSSAAMFHIKGITPEAAKFAELESELPIIDLKHEEIVEAWRMLNSAQDLSVDLVSLGNPHFFLAEFQVLAKLCSGRKKSPDVKFIITTGRNTYELAEKAGYVDIIDTFGATIITDTCWCMLGEPVIPLGSRNIMTNSAKYAHYAPGMVKRGIHFGSLAECVEAGCGGRFVGVPPGHISDGLEQSTCQYRN
ncbi:uncharacterized protein BDW43DRAFT_319835 [Aspergillus alliaceus]|uniref:uncharacterized protein n=1 Tax=Petromyces alliaceus TaxID=209559 RepID=UPI0012A69691|nr:uncharacterized protein BDW43DRAFT_319835 [Aspergillus alliaceus]KAB8233069.1 hypothetical protein BDW43DRAFT_319835 [Aspergillus alliaceus]